MIFSKLKLTACLIKTFKIGQAFCLLEGGHLWKVRIPLPVHDEDENLPSNLKMLTDEMQKNYRTSEAWWQ